MFLNRTDVIDCGGHSCDLFVNTVAEALALHARGDVVQPLKPYLRWRPNGHIADRIIAMPAYLGGDRPTAGLKWIGSKHDNPARLGRERASALIILNDVETHYPLAVMEGGLISAGRTAALTAVATRHLARADFTHVACIGCGPIGRAQVLTTLEQFPHVEAVHLYDLREEAATRVAKEITASHPGIAAVVEAGPEEAVRAGDVVITCT
ncbi:MAG: 2,3-diaminopropionate biosynthesis protein SbnB, partial [Actinomycetota bacterium]